MAIPTLTTTMVVETVLVEVALAIMIGGITPTVLQATLTAVAAAVVGVELPAEEGGEVEDVAVLPVAVAVAGVQAALLVIGAVSLGTLPMPAQTIRSICIYFTIYLSIYLFIYLLLFTTYIVMVTRRIAIDRLSRRAKEISTPCIQGSIPTPEDP